MSTPTNDIAVIYPCHNRLDYTRLSLPRVLEECWQSKRFAELRIYDDDSTDGTSQYIKSIPLKKGFGNRVTVIHKRIGNSVDQTNDTLQQTDCAYLFKVDNDILLPEGAFDYMAEVMDTHPDIAFLMLEESNRLPRLDGVPIVRKRTHIGGVGIFRKSVMDQLGLIPTEKVYFGFTEYQIRACKKLDVQCAMLENGSMTILDASRAYGRPKFYKEKGWGRIVGTPKQTIYEP